MGPGFRRPRNKMKCYLDNCLIWCEDDSAVIPSVLESLPIHFALACSHYPEVHTQSICVQYADHWRVLYTRIVCKKQHHRRVNSFYGPSQLPQAGLEALITGSLFATHQSTQLFSTPPIDPNSFSSPSSSQTNNQPFAR